MNNLFVNFYKDKDPERQKEIDACLERNSGLNRVVIVNKEDKEYLEALGSDFRIVEHEGKPNYNFYFSLTREYPDDINIIANSDIVIGDLSLLEEWNWEEYCLALTRWDYRANLREEWANFYNQRGSQDTWILKGGFKHVSGADFPLGTLGCDNSIAYHLNRHYKVINPSFMIKTYHYHLTEVRNYKRGVTPTIPRPYKILSPTNLP